MAGGAIARPWPRKEGSSTHCEELNERTLRELEQTGLECRLVTVSRLEIAVAQTDL
jgi:hypothetical protein